MISIRNQAQSRRTYRWTRSRQNQTSPTVRGLNASVQSVAYCSSAEQLSPTFASEWPSRMHAPI